MFFYEEHTEDNIKKCKDRLDQWGDVEICYNMHPTQPIVVLKQTILGNPFAFKRYAETQQEEEPKKRKIFELSTLSTLNRLIYFCILTINFFKKLTLK